MIMKNDLFSKISTTNNVTHYYVLPYIVKIYC